MESLTEASILTFTPIHKADVPLCIMNCSREYDYGILSQGVGKVDEVYVLL
jgi:hypothetical protein